MTTPTRPPSTVSASHLGFLGRLGRGVARHHRWVALVWIVLVVRTPAVPAGPDPVADALR